MTVRATVSAGYASALLDLAVSHGAPREALLARAGIAEADLADADTRIHLTTFKTLMRAGKELSGEPMLGLLFGSTVRFNDLTIVGLITHVAPDMPEAFRQMNRYGRLVIDTTASSDSDRFVIMRDGNRAFIIDTRKNPNEFPELTESTLGRFICGTRYYFPETPLYCSAEVTHAAPAYADEYARILGVPVTFSASRNAMEITEAFFTLRLSKMPRYVFGSLSARVDELMKALDAAQGVGARVEALILPVLHTGDVTMDSVAARMGVSRQTLYRQLKAEGASFDTLLDSLRHQMALHYLSGEKVSVNETAYLVGFSDPSSFSRAFHRWTGTRPGQVAKA
ncbi:AraC family transcriptional regulator ligand-binding domain-containing protein [Hyphomonas sp.]|jgi:AraC-like DNA-binding protein|uniref:AraC family transcriptional regulator n=1 Tax=Hyphomonas sp. TaxID=87 RepID=UPI0039E6CF8B